MTDLRFWTMEADPEMPDHPKDMIGIVDDNAGGIIGWADTHDAAETIAILANILTADNDVHETNGE